MLIPGFCNSACISRAICHADFLILIFCIYFHTSTSCEFPVSVNLHVFLERFVMQILRFSFSACISSPPLHAEFPVSMILHVFLERFVMQILRFSFSACISSPPLHANSRFLQFCMYFSSDLSCRFITSVISHEKAAYEHSYSVCNPIRKEIHPWCYKITRHETE